ncbi:folate-binding protein YgfZ [Biformimicrobium ophioploci]|uniref:Folate-binding protein YgfZ n=2 Tax=Biformimicrobium ophioploci TaxID=3036711 RepID=A0ABQ6LZR1_9GAMM|nr:folate-binding protein YgfZ [Microbulbifer sp. NKW57]
MQVAGADTQKLLQGQLTCDVTNLATGGGCFGAHCNPKGRMISAFHLLKESESSVYCSMPRDQVAAATAALGKYAVFFKADVTDVSEKWRGFGLAGATAVEAAAGIARPGVLVDKLTDSIAVLWTATETAEALWQDLAKQASPASTSDWQLELVRAGLPEVSAATAEQFIPQMINLQALGGVSFDKGCYTGQEVIARMQFRDANKKRMFRLVTTAGEQPQPGSDVLLESGKAAGEVVTAAGNADGVELLAVLNKKDVAGDSGFLLPDGRELALADIPYDGDFNPLEG